MGAGQMSLGSARLADAMASAEARDVHLADIGAQVEVRRHPGARRLTLRVSRTRRAVIVTLPLQCDLDEAGTFISRHIDWVRARLDSLPDLVPFAHGMAMPLRGTPHAIAFTERKGARAIAICAQPQCRPVIQVPGDPDFAANRLRRWLFEEARRDLEACVKRHTRRIGVRAARIAVRDQTSRWGSCSTTGALSFSWRLIMAPSFVLDYVAAHEVAHLAEMNHGPRFWALVEKLMPDYERAKVWLQERGPDLHRYGASHAASD